MPLPLLVSLAHPPRPACRAPFSPARLHHAIPRPAPRRRDAFLALLRSPIVAALLAMWRAAKIQNDLRILTERLARINDNLARKITSRNEYDKTIQETEAAYSKVPAVPRPPSRHHESRRGHRVACRLLPAARRARGPPRLHPPASRPLTLLPSLALSPSRPLALSPCLGRLWRVRKRCCTC